MTTTTSTPIQLGRETTLRQHSTSEKPNYAKRWAAAIGITALAAIAAKDGVSWASDHIHEVKVANEFSVLHLDDQLKDKHINLKAVTERNIQQGETPTEIANSMHARDTTLVADIISIQEGGDHNLHLGDTIVIPNELLETPRLHNPK